MCPIEKKPHHPLTPHAASTCAERKSLTKCDAFSWPPIGTGRFEQLIGVEWVFLGFTRGGQYLSQIAHLMKSDALRRSAKVHRFVELLRRDGKGTTAANIVQAMKDMKWANTGGDDINCGSVRVVSTLLKIHNSLVLPEDIFEACQKMQYCFGSSLFSVWKLEAIIVCGFEKQCPDETLEVLQTLFWKLVMSATSTT